MTGNELDTNNETLADAVSTNYQNMSDEEKKAHESSLMITADDLLDYQTQDLTIIGGSAPVKGEFLVGDKNGKNKNLDRLEIIQKEMIAFNKDIDTYMRDHDKPEMVPQEYTEERTVIELEPISYKNWWGFGSRKEIETTKMVTDTKMVPQFKETYVLDDLRDLIGTGMSKLSKFNNELGGYKSNINKTVNFLLDTRLEYNTAAVKAKQAYVKAGDQSVKYVGALEKIQNLIDNTSGVDDKMILLEDKLAKLEIKHKEVISDEKIAGETAILKENYKEVITAYNKILIDTKEEARRWVTFIDHYVQAVRDIDITMENVYEVCNVIGGVSGVMGETTKHMRFIGQRLGQVYSVVSSGNGPMEGQGISVDHIYKQIEEKSAQEELYRADQKVVVDALITPKAQQP